MNFTDQIPKEISEFKGGDVITRVIPSEPYPNMIGEMVPDFNYIGIELTFIGILNGCIYVEQKNSNNFINLLFGPLIDMMEKENPEDKPPEFKMMKEAGNTKTLLSLPLSIWADGWVEYIDPKKYFGLAENTEIIGAGDSEEAINKKMKEAMKNEDYETADRLKKKLDDLKDKRLGRNKENNEDDE